MQRNWGTVIRVTGWLGIVGMAVNWKLTGQLSTELLALFGVMAGLGEGVDAVKSMTAKRGGE